MRTLIIASLATVCLCFEAQAKTVPLPENTIDCSAFKKQGETFVVIKRTTFDVGSTKAMTLENATISPRVMLVGGTTPAGEDLYDVLETKCGQK